MEDLIRGLKTIDVSLSPKSYLAVLLERAALSLGLKGGVIFRLTSRQQLQTVAASVEEDLVRELKGLANGDLTLAKQAKAIDSELPQPLRARGFKAVYLLPITGGKRQIGVCLWLSERQGQQSLLTKLEFAAVLAGNTLARYNRVRRLSVRTAGHRDVVREGKRAVELSLQLAEEITFFMDTIGEGIYGVDCEGKCVFINKAATKMLGFAANELLGYSIHELIHHTKSDGSPFPYTECAVHCQRMGTDSSENEEILWRKDGSCFPAHCTVSPVIREGQLCGAVVIFLDVSHYKSVENKLRDAQEFTLAVVNELPELIVIIDEAGRVRAVNTPQKAQGDLYSKALGDAAVGDNLIELYRQPPEPTAGDLPKFAKAITDITKGRKKEFRLTYPCYLPEGVSWLVGSVRRMEGIIPAAYMVSHVEITSIMEAEQSNKRLAATRQMILDSSGEGIFWVDPAGSVVFANLAACYLLGYSEQELKAQTVGSIAGGALGRGWGGEECSKLLNAGEVLTENRVQFYRKDGSTLPVRYSAAPMLEEDRFLGAVIVFSDLTKILRAEKARREADVFARAVVNNIPARIAITDREGNIIGSNSAWRRFIRNYGVVIKGTAKGKNYLEVCHTGKLLFETFAAKLAKGFLAVANHREKDFLLEYSADSEGATRWYQATIRNLSQERLLVVHEDITERRLVVEALKDAKTAAEQANRAKSEFLANMSHEIRTPLNAIIGMAELLSDTVLDSQQKQYVSIFRTAGDHLLSLIDNILDLSRIESERLELETAEFNLADLTEEAVHFFAVSAHRKGLELTCRIEESVPKTVVGDPGRLRQILVNLIGNAVKFTSKGEINVRVGVEDNVPPKLRFSVSDTGIGIPQEKMKMVFSAFTQSDSSTTRRFGGSGLGLKISERLVEMMGGRIWAQSRINEGSSFVFTIPLRPGAEQPTMEGRLQGLRVLVVDDNSTNRLILREYLAPLGAEIETAETGEQALALFQQAFDEKRDFDIILMDCRMPQMDGFMVTEHIRQGFGQKDVVIMMLTSDNSATELRRCKDLAINAYLVKPVRKKELIDTILAVLAGKVIYRDLPASISLTPAEANRARILLVEDSPDNTLLVQTYLGKGGYAVETAENGEIALAKFKAHEFDLVLMDIEMPVMDGYTATGLIREWEKQNGRRPAPIIALTAYAFEEDRYKSLAAGCTDHMTKPVSKQQLLNILAHYLEGEKDG